MSFLETIIRQVSKKFDLRPYAGALVMEALRTLTSERNGGLAGFISRFEAAGLGDIVNSWIGKGENEAVSPGQLDAALGDVFISGIATKVGLSASTAGPVLAFVIPKLVDKLTPEGKVSSVLPAEVTAVLSGGTQRTGATATEISQPASRSGSD